MNDPFNETAKQLRTTYGFKRPYFDNTHHYFAFLKFSYYWGSPLIERVNYDREISDQITPAFNEWRRVIDDSRTTSEQKQIYTLYYAWMYREAVIDLYLVKAASRDARAIAYFGIDVLPTILASEWCAKSEPEIWSLESKVDAFYFDFPEEYWPPKEFWPPFG